MTRKLITQYDSDGNPFEVAYDSNLDGSFSPVTTASVTVGDITVDNVAITSLPPTPAGSNNIGDVDIVSLPALPAGTNNIGDVDVASLPAIPAGDNNIGNVDVVSLPDVVISSMPALPAGTNNIGDVDVASLPPLPAGTNNIGEVVISAFPALAAGDNNIGNVDVVSLPSLPAGSNNIGEVVISSFPALASGDNNIGNVDILTLPPIPAGEDHVGQIGGHTAIINVTPTLTVHATYASGDFIGTSGTPMTFSNVSRINGGTGLITRAILVDNALQSIAGELWLFDALITPPNDSSPWSLSDADMATCLGIIPFSAASYYASVLNSVAFGVPLAPMSFKCGVGTRNLYGCFVTRGAPTYASGDLTFRLSVIQD